MNKLTELQNEKAALTARMVELDEAYKSARAKMVADPLHMAAALSGTLSQIQTQLEVFNEKLGKVNGQIEAETARINSPEVKKGVKQAEKISGEIYGLCREIVETFAKLQSEAEAVTPKINEAASLFQVGGREVVAELGAAMQFLEYAKRTLNVWHRDGAPLLQSIKGRG